MRTIESISLAQWSKPRPQWWIYASAAVLIFILAVADIGVVLNLREDALRASEKNLLNSSATLAEEADRAFQSVNLVLTELMEKLDSAGVADGESYQRLMSGEAVHFLLREKIGSLPLLDAITMIGADGKLINFSRYWPIPSVNVSDRDYFRALKADPAGTVFIGEPVQNRGDGSWTIYLARRVSALDGGFAGLVLGAMTTKYFEDFYHSIIPGETSAISMIRDDGILLARYPATDWIGKSFADTGGQRALNGGSRGTIREPSPIDGRNRIKAAARVPHYPVVILSTITEEEALANWSSVALTLSLVTVGCGVAIALAALAIGRWSKQQRILAEAREERAAAEAALLREREQIAEAANRAKSNFLATMSHEIRTPMNAVIALTDSLLDNTLDADKRKTVETIRDSGDILLRLLNDILDFSKMEAGRITFESLAFGPATVAQNMVAVMAPRAAAKGLSLTHEADPHLPAAVIGDAGRIRQILTNLVSNALKFTQSGGIAMATRLLGRVGDTAAIEWVVSDTGIGIPQDRLPSLFNEFSQADSSITRRFGGTGLGLAISKRLVDHMGGTMSVDSKEGRGTTFRFQLSLPITEKLAEIGQEHAAGEELLTEALRKLGRPLRVLVAEDNPTNQFVLAQLLKGFDIRATLANDGVEAVDAAAADIHDLIFMDVQMPEMDGLEATRAIRKRGGRLSAVPIIALTANAFPEDVQACRSAGMNEFVVKPIKKAQLVRAILKALPIEAPHSVAAPSLPLDPSVASPIDAKALMALGEDLGVETVRDMVAIFVQDAQAVLAEISAPDVPPADLQRAVHRLKGAAASACAAELAAAARALEEQLRAGGTIAAAERQRLRGALDAYQSAAAALQLIQPRAA